MKLPIQKHVNLQSLNTMAIAVEAENFIAIHSEMDLSLLFGQPELLDQSVFVLGGGSNILFTKNIEGLVIHNLLRGISIIKETDQHVWIKVAAGENWHQFVMYCVANNYGGVENLSLIPGSVGAAPIQNIGAYGMEVKDTIELIEAHEIHSGKKTHFTNSECGFSYRDSIFKSSLKTRFIISHVTFRLDKIPHLNISYGAIAETLAEMKSTLLTIKVVSDAVIKIRQSKLPDPKQIPNTGSFFKNPFVPIAEFSELKKRHPSMPSYPATDGHVKIPAAWLIEQCGWKGKMLGRVGVHEKQALVIVNPHHGSAEEILNLVKIIQMDVQSKFNITLDAEVQLI